MVKLREFFDRFKNHRTQRMEASRMTEFHGEYSKKFQFPVPLHPKNLAQLVHPFWGYLTAFGDTQDFSFDELQTIYLNQIAASYEKSFGRTLLGDELSCLSFWLIADENQKGWMTLNELQPLMQALKFSHLFVDQFGKPDPVLTLKKVQNEFRFNLSRKRYELATKDGGDEVIVRFDFVRDIFLERGL